VLAPAASLVAGREEFLALATIPPNPLARLLMHQVLTSLLARAGQDHLLLREVPVRDDGLVLGALLEQGGPLPAALLPLGLGALGRAALALLAARVLAARALLGEAEGVAALVALAVDAHADRLLDAQGVALGRVPLARLDLQAVALAELLGPLLE